MNTGTMDMSTAIDSLSWSENSYPLNEFVEAFGVPNIVRIIEGHYGFNDVLTFEDGQIVMLHVTRQKQDLKAEDSAGRPLAIPLACESKALLCPLSIYCRRDPISISQISHECPNIKYFRVLENCLDPEMKFLKPESILEVEYVDSSAVKFKDIEQTLPMNSRVLFEPLLDYREHTLNEIVSQSGLPAKVCFLPSAVEEQSEVTDYEFEDEVSNLGKVTINNFAQPEIIVVATKIDVENLNKVGEKSVKCFQISQNCSLSVCVSEQLLENGPGYANIVRQLNNEFLNKYDLGDLDLFNKCQYLDRSKNTSGVRISVLKAKQLPAYLPELKPEQDSKVPLVSSLNLLPREGGSETLSSVLQVKKATDETFQAGEKVHYENISDTSSDDPYEDIDHMYEDIDNVKTKTPPIHGSMTSQNWEDVPSGEDEYCEMSGLSPAAKKSSGSIWLTEKTSLKPNLLGTSKVENTRKILQKAVLNFRKNISSAKPDTNTPKEGNSAEGKSLGPKRENLTETSRVETPRTANYVNYPAPTDVFPTKLKPASKDSHVGTQNTMFEIENRTGTTKEEASRKHYVNFPLPADMSAPNVKYESKDDSYVRTSHQIVNFKSKSEDATGSKGLKSTRKIFLNLPVPLNMSLSKLKSDISKSSNGGTSAQSVISKSKNEDITRSKGPKPTPKPARKVFLNFPVPTDVPVPKSRSVSKDTTGDASSQSAISKSKHEDANGSTRSKPASKPLVNTSVPTKSFSTDQCSLRKTESSPSIPNDLSSLSVEGVGRLLTSLNMACYIEMFRDEQIDGEILLDLDETSLKSLQLTPFHITKLMKVIGGWRPHFA